MSHSHGVSPTRIFTHLPSAAGKVWDAVPGASILRQFETETDFYNCVSGKHLGQSPTSSAQKNGDIYLTDWKLGCGVEFLERFKDCW